MKKKTMLKTSRNSKSRSKMLYVKEKENFDWVRNAFSDYVKYAFNWEKETPIRVLNDFFADCLGVALENYYPSDEYFIKIDNNAYHEHELETKLLSYL